jgi:hypothetical protein
LSQFYRLLQRGLQQTASRWPPIRRASAWVYRAAHLRNNAVAQIPADYQALLREIAAGDEAPSWLVQAVTQVDQVTTSSWPGLFHTYTVPDLPRTNNALEQTFGAARQQERRVTGRKGASPALVVRGSVRVLASVVTRQRPFTAQQLRPVQLDHWRALRQALNYRHEARRCQLRFRRDPDKYLAALEQRLFQSTLPP